MEIKVIKILILKWSIVIPLLQEIGHKDLGVTKIKNSDNTKFSKDTEKGSHSCIACGYV